MKQDILTLLEETHAILKNDHFVLTSGRHSPMYINKDAAYVHPDKAKRIGELFAEKAAAFTPDVVAAPALGGIILSQWTAYALTKKLKREVLSVYTEKTPDKEQFFTRGYDGVIKGKKVLVIEDLTTTGGSVLKVVQSVTRESGIIVAVGVLVNRNPEHVTEKFFGAPFFSLADLPVESYEAKECPLCKKNIPINTTVGHGKKYFAKPR
jgi:orotate phosphoribosyltransferase